MSSELKQVHCMIGTDGQERILVWPTASSSDRAEELTGILPPHLTLQTIDRLYLPGTTSLSRDTTQSGPTFVFV